MRHARFVIVLAFIAAGCALLVASYAPRPVGVWVVDGSHAAIVNFFAQTNESCRLITHARG